MKIKPRRKLGVAKYLESDRDYVMNNMAACVRWLDSGNAKPTPARYQRRIQAQLDAYARFLQAEAIRSLKQLAAKNPGKVCLFISAMGAYYWKVGEDYVSPPAEKLFENAFDKFEWAVIPAPIRAEVDATGKLDIRFNW